MLSRLSHHGLSSALLAGLIGCTGQVGDLASTGPGGPGGTASPSTGRTGTADEVCTDVGIEAARTPFRRLSQREYNNTVYDLFGDDTAPADRFPVTSSEAVGFEVAVSPVQYELYADVAGDLARAADLDSLHSCADEGRGCAERFIENVGLKVWRRPIEASAEARLLEVYDVGAESGGHEGGLRLALSAMLQSPNFLYIGEHQRPDAAAEGDVVALDSFERASRLSYLLWQSTPDETLLAAAQANELSEADDIAAQVSRMMEDPRAQDTVVEFHRRWLHLDLEGVSVDGFDDSIVRAMETETETFVKHVLFESSSTLEELMTADYSFVNGPLAEIYGVAGVSGNDFQRVELDAAERSGILTHASFLAHTASEGSAAPVFRGKFVSEQFLCNILPEAPDNIPAFSESGTPADTLRDRLSEHRDNPACAGCHVMMDPIGFGFEHYDAAGRFREGDVDAAGELEGTGESDGPFEGAIELTHRLSTSQDLRQCMSSQWMRFAFRRLEGAADACSLRRMDEAFANSDYQLLSLIVALTQTDAFLHRRLGGLISEPLPAEDSR